MRPEITAIFIDDGGVMNDNELRGPEWQRLIAEFFVPLLGGNRASWAEANLAVIERLIPIFETGPKGQDYCAWDNAYRLNWLRGMAEHVGVTIPAEDAECLELSNRATDYITLRVRAAYPGATDAIRVLHNMGFTLFTASGEHSRELDGYLRGMGIRQHFTSLYGSDLVNTVKNSIEYYRRLFEHAGIAPNRALVVDDKPHLLTWANSLGAATCLVGTAQESGAKANFTVAKLGDLPSVLRKTM